MYPTPGNVICRGRERTSPGDQHVCSPKCAFCGGPHPMTDRTCTQRFEIPYIVRECRRERCDFDKDFPPIHELSKPAKNSRSHSRSSRGRSRYRSGPRSTSRSQSRSYSRSRGPAVSIQVLASTATEWADCVKGSQKQQYFTAVSFFTKIVLTNEPGELGFGWHIRGEKCRDVLVHKHVTFAGGSETTQEQAETSLCRIYCRNVKVDEFFVATESDALAALKKGDALFLCPGCGIEPIKTGQCTKFGESYYSHACSVTTAEGKQCLRCKYTRKLISNQMRRQKQNPKPEFRQRAARQSVQLLRTRKSSQKPKKW
ncbi:hypothetical protein HPB51_025820 [Rhipicephalus microplus]|uniref:Uncharacterized protein n=1 Tax=Rhipicephalus microplus TaxID=6941 RepID=A0A9J6EKM4_RHIMP|nr:hypothetical protein HPB51_025820 [Rhipicephalus microplus]